MTCLANFWGAAVLLTSMAQEARPVDQLVTEYPVGCGGYAIGAITTGSDDALWFTCGDRFARLTVTGEQRQFLIASGTQPRRVVLGPDGNVWFTAEREVGFITPAGGISEFLIPFGDPLEITPSSTDDTLWFTLRESLLGRIETAGSSMGNVSYLPVPGARPSVITSTSDGSLWFVDALPSTTWQVTPSGELKKYSCGPQISSGGIVVGPDANIWITESVDLEAPGHAVDRLTASGYCSRFPTGSPYAAPTRIVVGPDGNLWFVEQNGIGVITTTGQITEIEVSSWPSDITKGPDRAVWFTRNVYDESRRVVGSFIGRISATFTIPNSHRTRTINFR